MRPGDTLDDYPKADDPRWAAFLQRLRDEGIMDESGTALKPCKLKRGMSLEGFLIRVEVREESDAHSVA